MFEHTTQDAGKHSGDETGAAFARALWQRKTRCVLNITQTSRLTPFYVVVARVRYALAAAAY